MARTVTDTMGSSPLTRGKPLGAGQYAIHGRLIPAHAGKTVLAAARPVEYKAHPRSRGENAKAAPRRPKAAGSSPLTRGKRPDSPVLAALRRLIPAHAGKTAARRRECHCRAAHPRSRGENLGPCGAHGDRWGSSPLTRGKPCPAPSMGSGPRLIPAHAGKTWSYVTGPDNLWAHPRSRGENAPGIASAN